MKEALDILDAMKPREPTEDEWEWLDGLDRGDYFHAGYRKALEDAKAALRASSEGVAPTTHLFLPDEKRAACRQRLVTNDVTRNPKKVSCGGCKRTKAYADRMAKIRAAAEAKQ